MEKLMEKLFAKNIDTKSDFAGDGVTRKVLSYTGELMICEVRFKKGAVVAAHAHKNVQSTYVAEGKVSFTLKDKTQILEKGDTVISCANIPHSVEALEDSVCIDVFSPMREDFI